MCSRERETALSLCLNDNVICDPCMARTLLTIEQATKRCGVSRRTIYNWMAIGKLDVVWTAGGSRRIDADGLLSAKKPGSRARITPAILADGARLRAIGRVVARYLLMKPRTAFAEVRALRAARRLLDGKKKSR